MNSLVNKRGYFRKLSTSFAVSLIRTRNCLIAATLSVLLSPCGARADQSIYSDSLQADWYNWTSGGGADFSNTTPVHSGTKSIAKLDEWSLFMIGRYPPMSLTGFASLDFSFHGGTAVHSNVYVGLLFSGPVEPAEPTVFYPPLLTPGVWHDISIAFTPALANRTDFQGFFIGDYDSGQSVYAYYVDDIRLTSVPEPSVLGLFGMGWLIAARRFKGARN